MAGAGLQPQQPPQIQRLEVRGTEPGSAPPPIPVPSPWPVPIPIPAEQGPIPVPAGPGRGSQHGAAPTGGSQDGRTGALQLEAALPTSTPASRAGPGSTQCPGGSPPCTPMYLPAEGPSGERAPCRAEREPGRCSLHAAAGRTGRVTRGAPSPEHPALSTQPWRSGGLAFLRC